MKTFVKLMKIPVWVYIVAMVFELGFIMGVKR